MKKGEAALQRRGREIFVAWADKMFQAPSGATYSGSMPLLTELVLFWFWTYKYVAPTAL